MSHPGPDDRPVISMNDLHASAAELVGQIVTDHFCDLSNDQALEPGLDRYIEGVVDAHKEFRRVTAECDEFEGMRDAHEARESRENSTEWVKGFGDASHDLHQLLDTVARNGRLG